MLKSEQLVKLLQERHLTIASMESCTGGAFANSITSVSGASDVFQFGAITYSNEYKIKLGVKEDIINQYSVYSNETAQEMSKVISIYANSNIGVGITGTLNKMDKNNLSRQSNLVYISIYFKENNQHANFSLEVVSLNRENNKQQVVNFVLEKLLDFLNTSKFI